jgi:GPH family glycoside/pentoside/hexuronide:cation symporter
MANGRAGMMVLFATGQFGWSLASYGVLNLLAYFYMPPEEGGQALFPPMIFQGNVLAGLTLIGLIGASGRVFDAFTDPLIAQWSDRARSPLGRRRVFLLVAALPFAMLSAAVFLPPFAGAGPGNAIWLSISVALFYLAMTLYVVPYNALIAELGRTARERLHLATAVSVTWALGFAMGSQIYLVQDLFEAQMDPRSAFQRSILLFSGLAFLAMMIPALFLQENRYVQQIEDAPVTAEDSAMKSLRRVWSDRNFRWFALSDFLYWLALTFIQMGIAYYVVELMGKEKAYASAFMVVVFGLSFLCYAPVLSFSGAHLPWRPAWAWESANPD